METRTESGWMIALRYGFAVALVALGTAARLWLVQSVGALPIFVTLYPAVLLVASIAGSGPGILASLLAALSADYYFITPPGFGIAAPNDLVAVIIFTASNIFLCILTARMRRAHWREAIAATRAKLLEQTNAELEGRVNERTARIRSLALELTQAEQRERKRLAHLLHDHLQQLLVGARIQLGAIQEQTAETTGQSLNAVANALDEAIQDSKSLAIELSPPVLRDKGLVAAMHWLAQWMGEKHGLTVAIEAGGEIAPDCGGVCMLLFQCVRELLFNSVKHSGTHSARVAVSRSGNDIQIVVSDAGAGFDPTLIQAGASQGGFGLSSIRERIGLLGGKMEIQSAPGQGVRISLTAPLPPGSAH
ncbi:MAG: ATP-binding protein [Candidatus Sumerlaeia bacterium]